MCVLCTRVSHKFALILCTKIYTYMHTDIYVYVDIYISTYISIYIYIDMKRDWKSIAIAFRILREET